jgi:hypothetical protein
MGYYNNLALFCRTHGLDPSYQKSQDYYDVSASLGLSFKQQAAMINGGSTPCPNCGKGIGQSGHCFYCGKSIRTDVKFDRLLAKARQARNKQEAMRLWDQSVSIVSTAGERYLNSRKLELPPNPDEVLRWHRSCKFGINRVPCMVALFRNVVTDKPTAVHRTCISTGERMALGPIAKAAIKLWPLNGSEALAVGEGIETVLAAVQLGAASPPAWATSVANNLSKLPMIKGVKQLTILADNDRSRTGESNARELRRRWIKTGREVVIKMPEEIGADFNDLLRRAS